MSPRSAFRIEEHDYRPDQPDENNSFLNFLQGGLRLVTGAIGRLNRKAFRVGTPIATIGIRGTGFDLICEGACVSSSAMLDPARDTLLATFIRFFVKPAYALGDGNGMFAKVWSGAIEMKLGQQTLVLQNGRTAYFKNNLGQPIFLPDLPVNIRSMEGAPRPDKVDVRDDLFGGVEKPDIDPGLYVNVRKGDVEIEGVNGSRINLGAGEAGLAGAATTVRLALVPAFQKFDRVPDPAKVTVRAEKMIELFGDDAAERQEFECTVQ